MAAKRQKCGRNHTYEFYGITQVGGWVMAGGEGKAAIATKQSENPVAVKMRPFIHQLLASLTSEHFLPKLKEASF
jgi:hypothetical protein